MDPNTGNTYGPDDELPPDVSEKDLVEMTEEDFNRTREERKKDVDRAIERRNARQRSRAQRTPPPRPPQNYGRRGNR